MARKRHTRHDEPYLVVRTLASDAAPGHVMDRHRHGWHQLIYASSGVLNVWTERGSWIVPPLWAVWVPADIVHSIRFATKARLRTLYLMPEWSPHLPARCMAVTVSPLLRALILRATDEQMLDSRCPTEAAIATLIVDEFVRSGAPPFELPQPTSPAMVRAADLIAGQTQEARSTLALARAAGVGVRTLERRFLAETGMSPGQWRRQRQMLAALERLAAGAPTKQVAADAGYATTSAFIAAFRALFGTTPGRYFEAP
jgi:AraC-like DNA-binding protein